MASERDDSPLTARRLWVQPDDAPAFYAQAVQITGTDQEVFVQFYDMLPAAPSAETGKIETVTMRLQATVALSRAHAAQVGRLLVQHIEKSNHS